MNQKQKQTSLESDDLEQKFKQIQSEQIPVLSSRVVKLKYKSCCACGCSDFIIYRTVPGDSSLKDGDRIDNMIKGDRWNP